MVTTISDIQCYSFLFLVSLVTTFLIRSILSRPTKVTTNSHLLPSPPALPIIGHLHLLGPSLYKSLHNLSTKYGPLLHLRFGASHCLLVSSASVASEIFKSQDLAFASRPRFAFSDKLLYGTSGFVTAPYGDYWRFMKKLCVTELLGTKQLERSLFVRREEKERLLKRMLESARKKEDVDVGVEVMKFTNTVTCRIAMSTSCLEQEGEAEKIRDLVMESFKLAAKMCFGDVLGPFKKLGFWVFGKQALDLTRRYDELLERVLKDHEVRRCKNEGEREDKKDLMDILLEVFHDEKADVKITRTHIKAFFADLFIAGTDTSAESMQWAIALLINHPSVFNNVREEIESIVGKTRLVEESDIPNLPYLQAVVKETLRLYPPGPVTTRECRQNCKINGYVIPEKTAVAINLYAIMRDPDSWDDPNEFRPERFLASLDEQEKLDQCQVEGKGQTFNFVPFGAGRRGCPGTALAFSMIHTAVAALVQCFDLKVSGEEYGTKVDMQPGPGMSLSMARRLIDLFIAGTDTSAEGMHWVMAELINHPFVFNKVREEIESVVGKTRLVEESDIPNLSYLQAVVKETLRLYPPGPVTTRECRENCKINGYDIPEKTAVAINLYAFMRDPDSWDDPNEFRPERFLVSLNEQEKLDQCQVEGKGQSFNFVPFGAGRRGCPGTTLAFSMMNTAVAALVQCFDWKVSGEVDGTKVDMQSGPGMSLHMSHPLIVRPIVHFNPFTASM